MPNNRTIGNTEIKKSNLAVYETANNNSILKNEKHAS